MSDLKALRHYALKVSNHQAIDIIDIYILQCNDNKNGKYYLGGQLDLAITDNITEKHVNYVIQKHVGKGPYNSWKCNNLKQYNSILIIKDLIDYKQKNEVLNGIFRSICIWIIPAAKRAKMKNRRKNIIKRSFFNKNELNFHNEIKL